MDRLWGILLGLLFLLVQVSHGVKHDLPDNVEIIDPKSLGLAGADLDKFLGNVKLLPISGNGLLPKDAGGAKTQILTVGFEGDEGLNLDDFELPSVDGLPEAEKSVAKAAFNRFQEFFKNPNKSKLIVNDEDLIDESSMKEDGQGKSSGEVTTTTTVATSTFVDEETTLATATTPLTTTTTPSTVKPRRPVYRPRTTTSNPSSYLNRNRHKVRRPVKFRSTTTSSPLSVDDATTFDPSLYATHENMPIFGARFQPQQFQDYASAIRDFQSGHQQQQQAAFTRRPAPASDSSEGAPQGLLGFTQVKETGHNGPPIFDFSGFSPTKKPVTKFRHSSPISSSTTERQERTDGGSKIIDFTRTTIPDYTPNSGNQRFLSNRPHGNEELRQVTAPYQPPNRFRTSASTSYNVAPLGSGKQYSQHHEEQERQEYLQGPPPPQPPPTNEEPAPKIKKPSFEQIVAEPVEAQTVSAKVPFRFPSREEERFPAFNEPINDQQEHQEYQEQRPQTQQYQSPPPKQYREPPQQRSPQQFPEQQQQQRSPQQFPEQQQQQRSPQQFPEQQQQFTTAPEQIRILQQEYQRMAQLKREHEERAYRLQQELRLQQERTFQLTQQLRLQQKPPPQQALPKQQEQQRPAPPPPPQQRPQFFNQAQQQQPIRPGPIPSNYQQQVQSQVRYNVAPQGPPPSPQRAIIPLMPIQPPYQSQSFRPQGILNPNVRTNAFLPPQILPNPNFLQPHLNEKFISQAETPNHIVQNPINLFNVPSKSPQVYPLATAENALPLQHSHRFNGNVPNNQIQQQQQGSPQNFNSRPPFPPQQPPSHHHHHPHQNPHQFSSRALETDDGPLPQQENHQPRSGRAQNIQPATLIGTFSLSSQKSRVTTPTQDSSSS